MECVFQFLGRPRKHGENTPLVSYTSVFAWGPALAATVLSMPFTVSIAQGGSSPATGGAPEIPPCT